jgi:hypothetical protein
LQARQPKIHWLRATTTSQQSSQLLAQGGNIPCHAVIYLIF